MRALRGACRDDNVAQGARRRQKIIKCNSFHGTSASERGEESNGVSIFYCLYFDEVLLMGLYKAGGKSSGSDGKSSGGNAFLEIFSQKMTGKDVERTYFHMYRDCLKFYAVSSMLKR